MHGQECELVEARRAELVSVVMSVWNGARYVGDAIESILGQTHSNLELIIVDDGSTDGTPEIIEHYQRLDLRVIGTRQPHQGIPRSLSLGCSMARGEYLAHLDADDVALPVRLGRQLALLQEHVEVGIVGTAARFITAAGLPTGVVRRPPTQNSEIKKTLSDTTALSIAAS